MEIEICQMCFKEEIYDEGPLCEDCFSDVEMGRILRGDYGETERLMCVKAIGRSIYLNNKRKEIKRLLKAARRGA